MPVKFIRRGCTVFFSEDNGQTYQYGFDISSCDDSYNVNADALQRICAGVSGVVDWLISILNYNIYQLNLAGGVNTDVAGMIKENISNQAPKYVGGGATIATALGTLFSYGLTIVGVALQNPTYREGVL